MFGCQGVGGLVAGVLGDGCVQRTTCPAAAEGMEPCCRIEGRRAVQREGDELVATADRLPRHRAAQALLVETDSAVGAVVPIVAHQEDMACRDACRGVPVDV